MTDSGNDDFFNFLREMEDKVKADASEVKASFSFKEFGSALLLAYGEMPEKDRKDLARNTTILVMSLYGRRKIRKALIAAGLEPAAAKVITTGILWGAYGIGANAVIGGAHGAFTADNALYDDDQE